MKRESQMVRSYWDGMCFMVPYYLIRSSLAHNVMGHMHGLLCEEEPEKPTTKRPSGSDGYCGCGEHRDEEMIECMSGKVCGGWVHFSCAGIDFQNFHEDDKDQFICKWCRAAGVSVGQREKGI